MSKNISLNAPNIDKQEKRYLSKALEDSFVSTAGPFIPLFENRFASFLKAKEAVSMQSGTAALHIALHELEIKEGDEVIVPALTFVASVNPIVYTGAKPVFVDVSPSTWNIESCDIEKKITKKTKAIMPVHLYGNPCEMRDIMDVALRHKLFVVEDATESLGAKYKEKFTGTFGDLGCFSFNGNKLITTGGGGMVVGNDIKRLKHIKFLVNQAKDEKNEGYFSEIGFNYRMTNIEAALGLAQFNKLNKFLAKKRKIHSIYCEELKKIRGVSFQKEYRGARGSYWFTCIKIDSRINIDIIRKRLANKNIPTRRIFIPVVEFPHYKKYKNGTYGNSYDVHKRGLCLPSCTTNTEDDIYYVCETLKKILDQTL